MRKRALPVMIPVVIVLVLVAIGALAQQPPGFSKVYGYGSMSCGRWVAELPQVSDAVRVEDAWVLGFVSGFNWGFNNQPPPADGPRLKETDSEAIRAWVTNHCKAHPLDQTAKAAAALIHELAAAR